MNLASTVEEGRYRHPGRAALIFEGEIISYQRLDELANREAARLRALGIGSGDRVALCLPNTPQFAASYLGILKLGAIAVSINPTLTPHETAYILEDSGAREVIRDADMWRKPDAALRVAAAGAGEETASESHAARVAAASAGGATAPEIAAREMASGDPAVIVYTSGTTGFPKGAVLSHGNVVFTMQSKRRYLGIRPEDRMLLFLPLFHCFGQNAIFNAGLCSGATLVMHRGFDKDRVLESIARDGVSMMCGVPANFAVLYKAASADQMRNVRYYMSAAAPLPVELEICWKSKFGVPIHQGYGLTETSPFASYNHLTEYQTGSIGSPIEGVEMAVADVGTGAPLPPETMGEIVVKGPNVMLGYWNRSKETSEAIRDGWFHTGDVGRRNAEGYFFIEDRLTDMAIVGGYNVYPAEVENALYRHPAVYEAAVYGVPDAVLGERVRAAVVLKPGASVTAAALIASCRASLAEYKLPAEIDFVGEIPRSRSGKMLKRVLRDEYHAAQAKAARPAAVTLDAASLERVIIQWMAASLSLDPAVIRPGGSFADFGLTSLAAVLTAERLSKVLGRDVPPTITWQYSTPRSLARHLAGGTDNGADDVWPFALDVARLSEQVAALSDEEAEGLLLAELEGSDVRA